MGGGKGVTLYAIFYNDMELFVTLILAAAAVWGYRRGILVQAASLLAFVVAIIACHLFGDAATAVVSAILGGKEAVADPAQSCMSHFMAECIGNALLFTVVWLGVGLLARTVKSVVKSLHMGLFDSLGGALFMVLKAATVISIIINIARFAAPNSTLAGGNGGLLGVLAEIVPGMLGFIQSPAAPAPC